jgi:hypothetical protein
MPGRAAKQALSQADWLFKDAYLSDEVQAIAQETVARSRDIYCKSAAAAQGGIRIFTEVAETAWSTARLLNDKVVRNVVSNTESAFNAAEACAKANSLLEIMTLQGEYSRLLLAAASEQTKEFFDLSARATQHVVETMQGASDRLMRTDF